MLNATQEAWLKANGIKTYQGKVFHKGTHTLYHPAGSGWVLSREGNDPHNDNEECSVRVAEYPTLKLALAALRRVPG